MSTTQKFSRLAPEQRREQILDAANALYAERAYDEVSIEDISSAAGVTRGLVHHYFGRPQGRPLARSVSGSLLQAPSSGWPGAMSGTALRQGHGSS
jgi:Bacterial regulatory proteins, tetR family